MRYNSKGEGLISTPVYRIVLTLTDFPSWLKALICCILTHSATYGKAMCTFLWGGVGRDGEAGFYRQAPPDLNFRIFNCFELGEGFEVDAVLQSPSPENVADGVLSISGQSGASGTACLSVRIEPQFCHPPGMHRAPSLCISHKGIIKIIRNCNNAFDGFRRISIIAVRITNERT